MNPELDANQLREIAWRRPLNPDELARLEACLRDRPELRAEWQADLALAAALQELPVQPAPSNLAARILAEVEQSKPGRERVAVQRTWTWWVRWSGGVAVVAFMIWGGAVMWRQHQSTLALSKFAKATEASSLPSPEALENFEVILKINPEPLADMQLLSLSQQLADFQARQ
jgi:hypothetical protein